MNLVLKKPRQCIKCQRWFYDSIFYPEGRYGCRWHDSDRVNHVARTEESKQRKTGLLDVILQFSAPGLANLVRSHPFIAGLNPGELFSRVAGRIGGGDERMAQIGKVFAVVHACARGLRVFTFLDPDEHNRSSHITNHYHAPL